MVNSCSMSVYRAIIPSAFKQAVSQQFPGSYLSVSRMKSTARAFAYCPGMDKDIEAVVQRCSKCQQAAKLSPRPGTKSLA
ncbi:unnamed protein product [Hymenolepis diminuta]|uniref:Integrase_H2C2 domain-containing protein n=1 Tax=Hymenolepis diminuta TaxID=6216 RepID=A0A0R3SSI2_HYMDI|nr:unnamed protein product [Hymenolepis diminuta]